MKIFSALLLAICLSACGADGQPPAPAAMPAPPGGDLSKPVVLIVGDSLSAGYGIEMHESWVALLEDRLVANGYDYRVVNASISGDTTAGGLTRLKNALPKHRPELVVIELGGNDGLRGIQLPVIERNLEAMIELSQAAGARIALLGIRIPTNYGPRYAEQFHALYQKLARRHDLPPVDFFLDGVALDSTLMQADGLHPNAAAQPRLLENAWPAIETALTTD